MSPRGQVVPKTLAILVAVFFLLGAVVTAAPALFGGSKVKTLFLDSQDALAGDARAANPVVDAGVPPPLFMHATKAGPMPVPPAPVPQVDAGKPATPKPALERQPVYFPASKSMGGVGIPRDLEQPTQQAQP